MLLYLFYFKGLLCMHDQIEEMRCFFYNRSLGGIYDLWYDILSDALVFPGILFYWLGSRSRFPCRYHGKDHKPWIPERSRLSDIRNWHACTSRSVRQLCIFAGGSLFATIVELAGGWILDKLFHARWWDYSKRRFNLNGYICLEFSILWGLGILFVVEIVHPFLEVEPTHGIIAHTVGIVLLSVFYVVFAADVIVTVLTVRGFNQKLAEIDEISAAIHIGSDYITEKIGDRACKTTVKVEEGMLQAKLGCAELKDKVRSDKEDFETLTENRRRELIAKRNKLFDDLSGQFGIGRLLKAFPNAKHDKHAEVMKELVDKYIRGAL